MLLIITLVEGNTHKVKSVWPASLDIFVYGSKGVLVFMLLIIIYAYWE